MTTATTTATSSDMPSRHTLRNAVRKWARTHRKDTYPAYASTVAKELATAIVGASSPLLDRVKAKVSKLLEVSRLVTLDTGCGAAMVSVRTDAKL